MATKQPQEQPEQQIDVTAAEWLMIIVTGFTGIFAGPFAVIPGAVVVGMFTYRLNPELMKASVAGKWVRAMLPAPAPEQDAVEQPSSTKASAATGQTAARVTPGAVTSGKGAAQLAMIDLPALARSTTILLVGSRGSGKSTLLRAILATKSAAKESTIAVYDPHAAPGDWPMATLVHNSEQSISSALASAYKRLDARRDERRKGIRTSGWPRITLAADEWGSIVGGVKLPKGIDLTPGQVSTDLMKQGRKFEIGFVAGAHGLANASLGCTGDQEAFLQSFDWIVSMGGFLRKMLPKEHAYLIDQIPRGTNEQGGTFPLIVACESPSTGEIRLLDMRGFEKMVDIHQAQKASVLPWQQAQSSPDQALLASMLGTLQPDDTSSRRDNELQPPSSQFQALQRDVTDSSSVAPPPIAPQEIAFIVVQLQQGKKTGAIAKALPGYNGRNYQEFKAKIEYVKRLLDAQPASNAPEASTDDEDEPPSWFGKAFDE